jgi:ATP-dependent RNA helicase RhlE
MNNQSPNGVFGLLLPEIGRAVSDAGYQTPTPIQEQSIPALLEGRDMLGCAQTGTGKTAAFTLPILHFLAKHKKHAIPRQPRVLILAPTRELAAQIRDSVDKYGKYTKISHTVIFGGVGQNPQVAALTRGVHVLVATPGRLMDLINQKHITLASVEIFVLDEADRMLDMGFIHDIKRVIALLPKNRQSLFYSATLEPAVVGLARTLVNNPVYVTVTPDKPTVDRINQKVMFVSKGDKDKLIVDLLKNEKMNRVMVFVQMKHVANKVAGKLEDAGIRAAAIHGNKSQGARTAALADFKAGRVRVLVATDIAARGIDVDNVSHVINYELPKEPETYVHRIGRTARAGSEGDAISFCCAPERNYLRTIENLLRTTIPTDLRHTLHCVASMNASGDDAKPAPKVQRGQGAAPARGNRLRKQSYGKRQRCGRRV